MEAQEEADSEAALTEEAADLVAEVSAEEDRTEADLAADLAAEASAADHRTEAVSEGRTDHLFIIIDLTEAGGIARITAAVVSEASWEYSYFR